MTGKSACPCQNACSAVILMYRIALFLEDAFHEEFVGTIIERLAREYNVVVDTHPYSVRGGFAKVHSELGEFLRDLDRDREGLPDAILVATDANCSGFVDRKNLVEGVINRFPQFQYLTHYAIPDPHIERWMLIDPAAFRSVFGKGCALPVRKCERGFYKRLLTEEILKAGIRPLLGGREYASEIVNNMDLTAAGRAEPSFGRFLDDLKHLFRRWSQPQG